MLGSQPPAYQVVRADEGVLCLVAESVDQHIGNRLVAQPAHGWILQIATGQDDAVHAAGVQAEQVRPLAFRAAVRIAEQYVVAAGRGAILDASKEGSEERIG